ncbi:Lipoprotein signal peptidase [Streptomyces alboniger]
MLFAVAAIAYLLDLVSKMIVVAELEHQEPIEIVGDWLRFVAIRNAGAAFGFGEAFTVIFTVIAAAVIVVIARLARKLYSLPWAIALGMLLGGALGNLTDRIFRSPGVFEGAVVDFIAPRPPSSTSPTGDRLRRHPDRDPAPSGAWTRTDRPQGLPCAGRPPAGTERAFGSVRPVRHTRRGRARFPEIRTLPVPDGLEGERVDAAISRMFGFSRTKAAELAAAGKVQVDGSVVGKSERVHGGAWLEVEMPQAPAPVQVVAEPVEGMEIVHDDEDVVVIVKPVGVAAHPSPGWSGPTVIGGLAAAGYRVSTSGAAERQGIVHRLDVGTSGLMVVAKPRSGRTPRSSASSRSARSTSGTTRSCRATPTRPAAPSTPPSAATPSTTTSGPSPPRASPP